MPHLFLLWRPAPPPPHRYPHIDTPRTPTHTPTSHTDTHTWRDKGLLPNISLKEEKSQLKNDLKLAALWRKLEEEDEEDKEEAEAEAYLVTSWPQSSSWCSCQ